MMLERASNALVVFVACLHRELRMVVQICFYLTLSRWTDLVASPIVSRVPGKCSKPYFVVLVLYYCFAMNRVYGVAVNAYIAIYIMFTF